MVAVPCPPVCCAAAPNPNKSEYVIRPLAVTTIAVNETNNSETIDSLVACRKVRFPRLLLVVPSASPDCAACCCVSASLPLSSAASARASSHPGYSDITHPQCTDSQH